MSSDGHYILNEDREAVPATLMEWAEMFNHPEKRIIARTEMPFIHPDVRVSTVFLGLDHAYGGGEPLLFETMIFGGEHDQYQDRCSTFTQALEMHSAALGLLIERKEKDKE